MSVIVDKEKCQGCGECVDVCPFGIIELVDDIAVIGEGCTLCGACIEVCPTEAISIPEDLEKKEIEVEEEYRGVMVFGEQRYGIVHPVVKELLGEGKKLSKELKSELSVAILGSEISKEAEELLHYGADRVYLMDDPSLKNFNEELYCEGLSEIIDKVKPEIFLAGATAIGRSLIPRVATRLKCGLTADCTELSIDQEKRILLQTRPAFGGNIMATIVTPSRRPQMATVRPKVMQSIEYQESITGEVVKIPFKGDLDNLAITLIESVREEGEGANIAEADIIVAGGRGMGDEKNFRLLWELAGLLGGAVGGSRGAVEAGWIDYSHQIGQTGRTVAPKLYIACGISGAVQHLVGIQSSDIIVAINNDPEAPIFEVANYAIVGDIMEVLPKLIEMLKNDK